MACDCKWVRRPQSVCPGVHVYNAWQDVPGHLATQTQLRRDGLRPASAIAGCVPHSRGWYWLYDRTRARPRRQTSEAQRQVLARGRATMASARQAAIDAEWAQLAAEEEEDARQVKADHEEAVAWARGLLARTDWCVLDTETTALEGDVEVVELAVLAPDSTVLLDTRVRPAGPIPAEATAIHGITDATVADAPTFRELHAQLAAVIEGREVVVYNVAYDRPVLGGLCRRHKLPRLRPKRWTCAMEWYAQWVGEPGPYGEYRWQPLPGGEHSAAGDARATLALITRMSRHGEGEQA